MQPSENGPSQLDWLTQGLQSLRATLARCMPVATTTPVSIRTFGGLSVARDGEIIELKGKGRALVVELLACGGYDVCAARVANALWPHGEKDYAMGALNTTLYRVRRQNALEDVLVLNDGRLSLNPKQCFVDRWLLESALESATTLIELADVHTDPSGLQEILGVVVSAYRGPLLEQDDSSSVERARDQLRDQVVYVLSRADKLLRDAGSATTSWLERIAISDPSTSLRSA